MKNRYLILIQITLSIFLISSVAFAAPTIDGDMDASVEWAGHVVVEYGESDGKWYDVEELGLWIDDNILYIGLQTDFHLNGGWEHTSSIYQYDEYGDLQSPYFIDPGDFALDFDGDGTYEAGIDFQISDDGNDTVSLTFFTIDSTDWMDPVYHTDAGPYSADPDDYTSSQDSTGAGSFDATTAYFDDDDLSPGDVLEIAIDLDTLSTELNSLFTGSTTVELHWTMECGNDDLTVAENYSYDPENPIPEPATLLLFGMGLLGISAFSRKKVNNQAV